MKALNAGQALAMVLVDELVRCGLAHACVAPGSRSTPLAMALAEHPGVEVEVIVDERSAAFCALGIAKASGVPAAIVCTSGTAAANFLPAVVEAEQSRTPLLVLTADRPPELRGTGANQTIDQVKLYGTAVRWFAEVGVPESRDGSVAYWRSTACRAWASAIGSPPGPVHLNLAFRDPLVPVGDEAGFPHPLEGRPGGAPWTRLASGIVVPGADDVSELATEVAQVERGLIIAGEGADRGAAPAGLSELAEVAGWPLLADPLSGFRTGEAIGAYEALLRHEPTRRSLAPELIIRAGSPGTSKALSALLSSGVRQIVIDADATWIDPERSAAVLMRADPGATAAVVAERLKERELPGAEGRRRWLGAWCGAEGEAQEAIDRVLAGEAAPTEPGLARDLAAGCPDGTTLVVASSMPVRDLEWFMQPRDDLRVLANRGASGIDGFASTAFGAALGSSGPVVALAGDLSMLHDRNGLQLAARPGLRVVFVVVNNNGGGIFSFLPQAEHPDHFEQLFGTPQGIDFPSMAKSAGCRYGSVDAGADLVPAVRSALGAGGVHLLEAKTDRVANVALHRRVWQAVGDALDGWQAKGAGER